MSDINIQINLRAQQARAQLNSLSKSAKDADGSFKSFNVGVGKTNGALSVFKGTLGAIVASKAIGLIATGLRAGLNAALEFETALVGVGKTTDLAGADLEELGNQAERLARTIPVSSRELLNLAQTAGQLGVRGTNNLLKFADTAARLASATDLGSEAAITGLTRIIRLTGESDANIDRLGASLVQLGNNFNATESQILGVALALSQSTAGFNIGADQILGFSTAIAEAGLGSQKAATAIGGILTDIAKAFSGGGKAARKFAEATGLSLTEVSNIINEDAGKALDLFIGALSDVSGNTIELTKRLTELGVSEKREIQVIQSLVKLRDTQTKALQQSAQGFRENTALQQESNRSFQTLSSELTKATEATVQLAKAILEESGLLNALRFTASQVQLVSGFWADYFSSVEKAKQSSTDLSSELTTLGESLGKSFSNVDLGNVEDVQKTRVAIVKEAKALQEELNQIQSGQIRFFGAKQTQEEIQRLQELRDRSFEIASQLATIESNRTAKEKEEQEKRKQNTIVSLTEEQLLVQEFKAAQALREQEAREQEQLARQLISEEELTFLKNTLGEEAAIRDLSRVAELSKVKKQGEAVRALEEVRFQAQQKAARQSINLERQTLQQRASILSNLGNAINAIAGKQTKAGFLVQQAGAAAQVIVNSISAEAAALAPPPLGLGPVAGAGLATLISANRNLQLAAIAGATVAGFEQGGVVGGTSFSGDNVMARVNSGEMILNRQQQAQLFAQANGQNSSDSRSQEIVVHTTVELDGAEIGRSVSRQVADGLTLGESL